MVLKSTAGGGAQAMGMVRPEPVRAVADAVPFSHGHEPRPIDLHLEANECEFVPPGLLREVSAAQIGRYTSAHDLEKRLAAIWGVAPDRVLVTAGADEALHRICLVTLDGSRRGILPEPTFEMLDRYVRNSGAERVAVPWLDGPFPIDAFVREARRGCHAAFVVSPNNPTGLAATIEDVRRVRDAAGQAVVVLDAAYGEFADDDPTPATLGLPGTVVTRSFSKAWGLAGLRVGYAVGDAAVIGWMRASCEPFPVAATSLAAVSRWLDEGASIVAHKAAMVRREREELTAHLRALGARPTPSQANFVFCGFDDAAWAADALAGLGIAVRRFHDRPGLQDRLRITCPGDAAKFSRLRRALVAALKPERIVVDADLHAPPEALRVLERRAPLEASAGPRAGAPGWFVTGRLDAIAAARAAGLVPIFVGDEEAHPISLGAARVVRSVADASRL
jgi:histidinol-phosphate aminotransferase